MRLYWRPIRLPRTRIPRPHILPRGIGLPGGFWLSFRRRKRRPR